MRPIVVEARLFGNKTGEHRLALGEALRVQFDWGGPGNEDVYVLSAYDTNIDNPAESERSQSQAAFATTALNDISRYLNLDSVAIEATCNEVCEFGALGMNRAFQGGVGQNGSERHQVGAHVAKDGHVIEAVASQVSPRERCGCMILRNVTTSTDVTIQATLHGNETGRMILRRETEHFVGFDSAGGRPEDFYVLSAVAVDRGSGATLPSSVAGTTMPTGTSGLKITDYVRVVGQFDSMVCNVGPQTSGAVLKLPTQSADARAAQLRTLNLDGAVLDMLVGATQNTALSERLSTLVCPFSSGDAGALGMGANVSGSSSGQ